MDKLKKEDLKEIAYIKMVSGKPKVKFPGDSDFGPLTAQFDHKPIKRVIALLQKLPANKGVTFKTI